MLPIKDPERLYRELGRLIESQPEFPATGALSPEMLLWLGRARTLVEAGNAIQDISDVRIQINRLAAISGGPPSPTAAGTRREAVNALNRILYMTLAAAEYAAPAGVRGTFIPVGSSFDAFAAVSKILSPAKTDVLIVDPYLDEVVLTDFAPTVPIGVRLRLLADQKYHKTTLQPAATRWNAQYGTDRPLLVRLAPAGALHDRAIFVDSTTAYTVTQSLKDLAKRSPAEIVRADDTAAMKIAAYEAIWLGASVVV